MHARRAASCILVIALTATGSSAIEINRRHPLSPEYSPQHSPQSNWAQERLEAALRAQQESAGQESAITDLGEKKNEAVGSGAGAGNIDAEGLRAEAESESGARAILQAEMEVGTESDMDMEVLPPDWKEQIPVITVETRTNDVDFPVPGVPGAKFHNIGAGQEWHGLFTKPKLFKEWLNQQTDPQKLVVFADAADVLFGGCSQEQLLDNYRSTVAKSGGVPVVMGAELGLDPPPAGAYTDIHHQFSDRRKKVQSFMALEENSYGEAAICEIKRSDPTRCFVPTMSEVKEGKWPCAGPCSWPPALTFLNSGFIMGPVWAMKEAVQGMIDYEELPVDAPFRNNWHDQGAATLYMAKNPNKITLDYTGSIVLNMHQLKLNASLEIEGGLFINRVTGVPQCFIHANGPALFKLNRSLIAYQNLPKGGSMRLHGW